MAGKVDSWETAEDMRALARVAEMKKSPARLKACREMMKGQMQQLEGGKTKK